MMIPDVRRPRLLLVAFCLLTWLPGLFTLPPTDRDESRFAQASKQMIQTGDYVRIMNGTEARNRKPIGIYWLQVPFAAAARRLRVATENPIWPYRIPSTLGGLAAVLATFELGHRLIDRQAGMIAAGMLASSLIVIVEVHLAKTDAALLGVTTAAMVLLGRCYTNPGAFGWRSAAAFWVAVATGILLKGPITPMIAGLTMAVLAGCDRQVKWLAKLRPGWGVPLMVLAVSPWVVAIEVATQGAFLHDALGGDLGRKLASGDDAHGGFPGLHLLLLPLLSLPNTMFVFRAVPSIWKTRRDIENRFLLAWIVPNWIVFEAVPTKLPHYTLPLYPAIFLLVARSLIASSRSRSAIVFGSVMAALASAVVSVGIVAASISARGVVADAVPAMIAVGIVGWFAVRARSPVSPLVSMPLLAVAIVVWDIHNLDALWIAPRIVEQLQVAGLQATPTASIGFHEPSLMFLNDGDTFMAATGRTGADLLAQRQVRSAVVQDSDVKNFMDEIARLGLSVKTLGSVDGLNYSRGRRVHVNLYQLP